MKFYCKKKDSSDIMILEGNLEKFIQSIQGLFRKLSIVQKRRLAIGCTVVFSLILTLSVIIPMLNKERELPAGPERLIINSPIPPGELFLPDEPDFVPDFLLERERRTSWTENDANEHWQNPLKEGEEQWRQIIESTVDGILERVQ